MTEFVLDTASSNYIEQVLTLIVDYNHNHQKTGSENLSPPLHSIEIFQRFIQTLRVNPYNLSDADYLKAVNSKIDELIILLQQNPKLQTELGKFLLTLINEYNPTSIYADIGMASNGSFLQKLSQLVSHQILPIIVDEKDIMSLIDKVFDKDYDVQWLSNIDSKKFDYLINHIHLNDEDLYLVATAKNNVLNAMVILSQRISGMGLNNELMGKYPDMLNYSSAFVAQNQETLHYVDDYRKLHQLDMLTDHIPKNDVNPDHLQVMLAQCKDIVKNIRKQIYKTGITVQLSSLLIILEKSLNRMDLLIGLVSNHQGERDKSTLSLLKSLVKHSKKRFSIWSLIANNTQLLSQKITENASRVGEDYITTDKSGYYKMFKKAALGGLIIPIMATIKILSYEWSVAPLWRAVIDSFIYGFGFVFIHVIHGTVATKQPAMTAAAIASTISDSAKDSNKKAKHQVTGLSELIVDIMRSQTVAIIGNIMLAMPIALFISWLWFNVFDTSFITDYKAESLLADLNPITSLAIPHAMLAGVFLFISGLVAGYYDNLSISNQIGKRISRHNFLNRWLSTDRVNALADYIDNHLGAIMSNFTFGMLLGSTGTIGYILGLPLDIRHIAFASANMAHGLFNAEMSYITGYLVFISALGVLLIGLANLIVSFSLALIVALRSKEVTFDEWGELNRLVFIHLLTHPLDFIFPRSRPISYQHIDNEGHLIHDEATSPTHPYTSTKNMIRNIKEAKTSTRTQKTLSQKK